MRGSWGFFDRCLFLPGQFDPVRSAWSHCVCVCSLVGWTRASLLKRALVLSPWMRIVGFERTLEPAVEILESRDF